MTPVVMIGIATALITGLKEILPEIKRMFDKGDISKEQQDEVLREYTSLKNHTDGQFSGPEWEQSGRSNSAPPSKPARARKGRATKRSSR